MDDRVEFLKERGWSTWYHPDYWVNPKTIENPVIQDYTNYGMSLEQAYEFEVMDKAPYQSVRPLQRCIAAKGTT
jgi:hypothetical protein